MSTRIVTVDYQDRAKISACEPWDGMLFVDFFDRMRGLLLLIPLEYRAIATVDYDGHSFNVVYERPYSASELEEMTSLALAVAEQRREDRRRTYEELRKEFGE